MADQTYTQKNDATTTVATWVVDQVTEGTVPVSKMMLGADDTNDGFVSSANPLPVTGTITAVTDITNTVTVSGTVTSNLSAVDNAVLDAIAASVAGTLIVDGSGVTQPISAASLPLPSGASTAAKQPALGTAGTASSDVITVQGITSMTPLVVDLGANNDVTLATLPDTGAGDLAAINAAVSGTLTVGSHAVTNAGTFAVQLDGDALTSLQLIDDAIYTDGSGTPTKGMAVMGTDGTNPQVIATDSSGAVSVFFQGIALDGYLDVFFDGANAIKATTYTDDQSWTALTSKHLLTGGVYQSTPGTITDGDTGPLRLTSNGAAHVSIQDASVAVTSASALDVSGATVTVDNGGTFAVQVDGAALTALQTIDNAVFADDAAFTLGSSSVTVAGAIRDDSLSTLSAVEGDAVPLRVSSTGALHVTGGGGGTQYSIDDAGPTVVTMAGVVRDDSLTTLTEVDGDATVLRVNSTGALHVTGGGGGTEYTEDVATANPIVGTATLMERDDALSTVTPIEGDWIAFRGTAEGALWTQDFNSDAILADTTTIAADTTSIDGKITACNTGAVVISSGTVAATQSGTWNITNISGTVSLPTGAATAAKQPALGTAGTASSDVITVQGIASMTALVVDGSGVTQPVSASSLPLPSGASTAANQSTIIGHVDGIEGLLTTIDADTGSISTNMATVAGAVSGTEMQVDIVSGTVTANLSATDNSVLDTIETNTSPAASHYRNIDANAESAIKGSAGTLHWIHAINLTSSVAYLHLYDATTASVTPGTTTPDFTFPIPTSGDTNGAGFVLPLNHDFATAITLVCTTTTDGSTGDPGTNGVFVNAGYT